MPSVITFDAWSLVKLCMIPEFLSEKTVADYDTSASKALIMLVWMKVSPYIRGMENEVRKASDHLKNTSHVHCWCTATRLNHF